MAFLILILWTLIWFISVNILSTSENNVSTNSKICSIALGHIFLLLCMPPNCYQILGIVAYTIWAFSILLSSYKNCWLLFFQALKLLTNHFHLVEWNNFLVLSVFCILHFLRVGSLKIQGFFLSYSNLFGLELWSLPVL